MMHMSQYGLALIKEHEGLRLRAYMDPVGIWTIGYGHTGNVRESDKITTYEAEAFLMADVAKAEHCVHARVRVPLHQGQFDALVSFVFNVGCGAFGKSTLLRFLNAGEYQRAADQLPRWTRGGGKVLRGLEVRRDAEKRMFFRKEKTV